MPLFILTGGPCSGKTTLANALAAKGLRVVAESAAQCIAEMRQEMLDPNTDFEELQRRVFSLQRMKEDALLADRHAHKQPVVLDRSLIDVCAYFWSRAENAPKDIYDRAAQGRYQKVFLLALLPPRVDRRDGVRYETNPDDAFRIQAQLRKAYAAFGYTVIDVPIASVEERAALVLREIEQA